MIFLHVSDLHLGKRVNEFSMLDDQRDMLEQFLSIVDNERPDAVLIAGDVYDKPVPPAAAVELFDEFLSKLSQKQLPVFIISGNHDSAERLAFGARLMQESRVYFSKVYDGEIAPVTLTDEHGEVDVWLLPFLKPTHVRHAFDDDSIVTYTDAMRVAIAHLPLDPDRRNLLVTHQFVTGGETCESEELSVGGSDNVDASVFDAFDYVALGHLHGAQHIGRDTIRYSGTPLKYSFSETHHHKSATVVTLGEKGNVTIRTVPFVPTHDMIEIEGTYDEVTARSFYENSPYRDAYLHVTLTDEDDIPDAVGKLRVIYPLLMKLSYNNTRTKRDQHIDAAEDVRRKDPLTLFAELYERQNNQPMSDEQLDLMRRLIEEIGEVSE
ncbi:MAG: exonuclease SbcCD subunit D [Clostridia bacterium]|nr:exonuclease SbcCD subunit D [Clostridia bacterium]